MESLFPRGHISIDIIKRGVSFSSQQFAQIIM